MTATIKDVALKAGVSVATVSRVLNGTAKVSDDAREAVLKAQRELGFYLNANARTLAKKDSDTIGILVSDISDPYFASMIKSCDVLANSMGKHLLITQGFYDPIREHKALDSLLSHKCSGLILHVLGLNDDVLSDYMKRFPQIVLINRYLEGFEHRCVNIDNEDAMYSVVSYLIENGHKKIAYITSSFNIKDANDRLEGYKKALREHNLPIDEDLIIKSQPSLEGGAKAAKELLSLGVDRFTAVACYSDSIAASAMSTFEHNGIQVPKQVSFTGFDDLFLSSCLNPALTTVTNPIEKMGAGALKLSLALRNNDNSYKIETFKTELIKRNSVEKLN
ncbi:MAG: substrate-binding domain-containing protein [Aeromonadales bacterium]|nr:substrate-binding domain-containing protein [Aeromonadales bacterium]